LTAKKHIGTGKLENRSRGGVKGERKIESVEGVSQTSVVSALRTRKKGRVSSPGQGADLRGRGGGGTERERIAGVLAGARQIEGGKKDMVCWMWQRKKRESEPRERPGLNDCSLEKFRRSH